MEDVSLHTPELKRAFSGRSFFRKTELRDFYRSRSAELSEKTFRRILYALEKGDWIRKIDIGVYTLGNDHPGTQLPKKFIPTFSPELSALNYSIKATFPYVEYFIWETRILHEFMLHQPGQNQIILETEKETTESVFNYINDRHGGKVFLQPDRVTFERYILPRTDSIIVSTLITQSPHQKVNNIPYPKMEKILVDIFADDKKFYVFQGQELVHIFEDVFERYRISEKTLFRYAERRKVAPKILTFINQETDIKLIQQREAR
jgi:hypothetical protein